MIDTNLIKKYADVFNSLLLIDIDNFSLFNQRFGREVGDNILDSTNKILKSNLLKEDVILSGGSDEFLIFSSVQNKNNLVEYANRLKNIFSKSLQDLYSFNLTFSIASTLISKHTDLKDLLFKLRFAINEAKANGKDLISYIN